MNPDQLIFTGKELTFLTPSNSLVTVREINGDDEDALTRIKNSKNGSAISKFLARIVVGISGYNGPITDLIISQWKSRDIYYTLYKARIHSMGYKVNFQYTFDGDKDVIDFEENLNIYDWDFSAGAPPRLGERDYNELTIQPYPEVGNPYMEGKTASGKEYRMKYLTGELELTTLGQDVDNFTINEKLRLREFEVKMSDGTWIMMENFAPFSHMDMKEFRNKVDKFDPAFELKTTLTHPRKPLSEKISLFTLSDFFFPTV